MTKVDLTEEQKTQIILALDAEKDNDDWQDDAHHGHYADVDPIIDKITRGHKLRPDEARAVLCALTDRLAALSAAQRAAMQEGQILNMDEINAVATAGEAIEKAYYADDGMRTHNSGGWALLS